MGIDGPLFFHPERMKYYPTRRDEEAINIR
jgi:hypothetical protein